VSDKGAFAYSSIVAQQKIEVAIFFLKYLKGIKCEAGIGFALNVFIL